MRRVEQVTYPKVTTIIVVMGLLLAILSSGNVMAQSGEADGYDPFANGGLILQGKGAAEQLPAMRLGTDIQANVTGTVARVTVTQAFRNTSDEWMEATYLYPLPDDGAVDDLKMVVGDRILIGHIREREEARQIYEEALEEGRQAGLVEQARPNMFRTNVANVGPGETVLVAISFQAPVRQLGDEYALRLPLVVGQRYVPPRTLMNERGQLRARGLADASRVTAPVLVPSLADGMNPVSISVALNPGFTPGQITSPYHGITIANGEGAARLVTLEAGTVPADRDFELRWRSAADQPALGLFRQNYGNQDYIMATITPPIASARTTAPRREMIFVVDSSGSMSGASMDAARQSLLHALGTLRPQDSFNIIRFSSSMTQLFDEPVRASGEQMEIAHHFASSIHSGGGTNMLTALNAALEDKEAERGDSVRQVIFLTDGALSNEAAMMEMIARQRGRSRIFMVGIGSAPNNYLMRRMAEAGRGTFTNIGTGREVETKMRSLLNRLAAPVAHDLAVSVDGSDLQFVPADLPDLYAGEPLVLLGRGQNASGTLTVTGTLAGRRWSRSVNLADAAESTAVAQLWGRRRVDEVEAQRWSHQIDHETAAAQIAALGLQFHIVTAETSLIAVDETPVRPEGAGLTREELPLLLPAGWDFDMLFGPEGQGRHADAANADDTESLDLPQTALPWSGQLQSGLLALLAGLIGLVAIRRRKVAV